MASRRAANALEREPALSHVELGLTADDCLSMYRTMVLARSLDERMWILNRQGKAPFVISCQGQEAAQVGSAFALRRGVDWVAPYYRDAGVVLTLGMTARDLMLGLFARAEDPSSGGRQMPAHYGSRRLQIISGSSPVATQVLHAVGVALAAKMRGEPTIAWTSFGEGSSNQGDVHEGMNFAGVHKLPVIFCCENNRYAISVPQSRQVAARNVADRAVGYGFPGVVVDGNDVLAVYRATREAAERARRGDGPTLIEAQCYRFTPHSSDDDDRTYRAREEVEAARRSDPIQRFRSYLLEAGLLTEARDQEVRREVNAEVDDAVAYAEAAPYPPPESALLHVYAEDRRARGR